VANARAAFDYLPDDPLNEELNAFYSALSAIVQAARGDAP
jgi:hypothetical protein